MWLVTLLHACLILVVLFLVPRVIFVVAGLSRLLSHFFDPHIFFSFRVSLPLASISLGKAADDR